MTRIEIKRSGVFSKVNFELVKQLCLSDQSIGTEPTISARYPDDIAIEQITDDNIDTLILTFETDGVKESDVRRVIATMSVPEGEGTWEKANKNASDEEQFKNTLKSRLEQAEADIVLLKQQVQQLLGA